MVLTHHIAGSDSRSAFGYGDLNRFMTLMTGDEKHSRSATSTLDVIWALYDSVLNVGPEDPNHPARDRFYLSKGHGPMAYYAVLAAKGFIDPDVLSDFGSFDSMLGHHPDRTLIPGVEISSGSLGMGLGLAVGATLGIGLAGSSGRVFCLMGDGELDEGANHEAIAVAGRLSMGRLTAIVIDNRSALHGWPGGIASRFEVEGWESHVVDGRDHGAFVAAVAARSRTVPGVIVAEVGPRNA